MIMKTLGKTILGLIELIILFFAVYAVFCVFIPALISGAPFIEVVKEMALGIVEGFKFIFGIA